MATTQPWVEYYQMNAGLDFFGDCAIVLLVKKKGTLNQLLSAVLVDCGSSQRVIEPITRLIKRVQSTYVLKPEDKKQFKFDAVVITHWDKDHFGGLEKLFDAYPWTNNQFPLFRYTIVTSPAVPTPLTKLFCGDGFQASANSNPFVTSIPPTTVSKPIAAFDMQAKKDPTIPCLRVVPDFGDFLGVNLFNAQIPGLATGTWTSTTSLEALLAANNPGTTDAPNAPGFYIVAGEQQVLGSPLAKRQGRVIKDSVKGRKNQDSLVSLLIWKGVGTGPNKVSLYTGGDAEYIIEDRVATWLQNPKPYTVKAVKAGHHGSAAGTSMDFISQLKPDLYLLSTGTEHQHPSPEVLFYLYEYARSRGTAVINKNDTQNFIVGDTAGTRRYFHSHDADVDKKYGTSAKKPYQDYLTALQALAPASEKTTKADVVSKIRDGLAAVDTTALVASKTGANFKKTILYKQEQKKYNVASNHVVEELARLRFEQMCTIPSDYIPAGLFKDEYTGMEPANIKATDYVRVIFTSKDALPQEARPQVDVMPPVVLVKASKPKKKPATKKKGKTSQGLSKRGLDDPLDPPDDDDEDDDEGTAQTRRRKREASGPATAALDYSLTLDMEKNIRAQEIPIDDDEGDAEEMDTGDPDMWLWQDIDYFDIPPPLTNNTRNVSGVQASAAVEGLVSRDLAVATTTFNYIRPYDGLTGDNVLFTQSGSREDSFVCALADTGIATTLTTTSSIDGAWTSAVSSVSAFYLWIRDLLPVEIVTSLSMSASGKYTPSTNNTSISILSVIAELPKASASVSITLSSAYRPTSIPYEPSNPDTYGIVNDQGFVVDSPGVLLGLVPSDNNGEVSMTLTQVCDLVGFDVPIFLDSSQICTLHRNDQHTLINGLWYFPMDNNKAALQLNFQLLKDSALAITPPGCIFTNTILIIQNVATLESDVNDDGTVTDNIVNIPSLCLRTSMKFEGQSEADSWDAAVAFSDDGSIHIIILDLQWNHSTSPLGSFWTWLTAQLKIDTEGANPQAQFQAFNASHSSMTKPADGESAMKFREIKVVLNYDSDAKNWSLLEFDINFELDVDWGIKATTPDARVPLELSFKYMPPVRLDDTPTYTACYAELTGELWLPLSDRAKAIVQFNPQGALIPVLQPTYQTPQYYVSLPVLLSANSAPDIPNWLPTAITQFSAKLSTTDIGFSGTLAIDPTIDLASQPTHWLKLQRIQLAATYTISPAAFSFGFGATLTLNAPDPAKYMALMDVEIAYQSSSWHISGQVGDLNGACLYSLFNGDSDAIMTVLSDLTLEILRVTFDHSSSSQTFSATGRIDFGPLELDLDFQNLGSTWSFSASLKDTVPPDTTISLADIVADISSGFADNLPDFLTTLIFDLDDEASITLDCEKIGTGKDKDNNDKFAIIFSVRANFLGVELSFVQLKHLEDPTIPVKRLFKFTLGKLPSVDKIPILPQLEQPFDQLDFLWATEDFTSSEVDILNTNVYEDSHDRLVVKQPHMKSGNDATNVALAKGVHFMIVVEEDGLPAAILDHTFAAAKATPPSSTDDSVTRGVDEGQPLPTKTPNTTALWSKTIGPLTISSIALKFEDRRLVLTLDAKVKFGPVEAIFKGLGISFEPNNLTSLSTANFDIMLSGIGIEMNRPPVVIAGEFLRLSSHSYAGGIIIEVEPYAFVAGGFYDNAFPNPKAPPPTFKSLFVFVAMEGPVATIEFASLSGLTGGFGYNSQITLPDVDNVTSFPFLNVDSISSSDPLAILNGFLSAKPVPWFAPADGPMWFAAGLTVQLFQVLWIKAVVVIDVGPDVIFGIFAEATASIPEDVTDPTEAFALIDMGIVATLDYSKGLFRCEGQLTPRSFILSQQCKLSGGFALCHWFEGSGHEGDWVFTVGGYHPAYVSKRPVTLGLVLIMTQKPPAWYPVPKRLAITWQYDDTISILGESYFAITPKCCMGGGGLHLRFHKGNAEAWLDATADFLINYRPFAFTVDISITVGAKYSINIAFVHSSFDGHIGAQLHLQGPPVSGYVHIDLSIYAFDIVFGQSTTSNDPLDWAHFCALLRQEKTVKDYSTDNVSGKKMHNIEATDGMTSDTTSTQQFNVKQVETDVWSADGASFAFAFASLFPITSYIYDPTGEMANTQYQTYMKPMHTESSVTTTSKLTIYIDEKSRDDGSEAGVHPMFGIEPVIKQVPSALWTPYDQAQDPMAIPAISLFHPKPAPKNLSSLLDPSDGTVAQIMGFKFSTPPKDESDDTIELNISAASIDIVPGGPPIPDASSIPSTLTLSSSSAQVAIITGKWPPIIASRKYSARNIVGRVARPKYDRSDVLKSWATFSGALNMEQWNDATGDPATDKVSRYGSRLKGLGDQCSYVPMQWMSEQMALDGEGEGQVLLPVLSAAATLDGSVGDGDWANVGWRGEPPVLSRDFGKGYVDRT
ncbi:uncharacterized protein KY384_008043 [Bacidia gigantensis]|uniref:uncharacterized protein n=1 Tax=Bacidia gigantensis TaxID=2732470 RepID=UPI001D03AAF4|nr:uncharacterized protein KY384_008043 [Bacidia gigantensis]KAG8527299.1 hypothetical protein KY384_008043 [Bacidia gigantensis]